MAKQDRRGPKERAYDAEISPLVKQIIALAKQHKIPLLIGVELDAPPGDEAHPLRCTSVVGADDWPFRDAGYQRAIAALQPRTVTSGYIMLIEGPIR